MALKEINVLHLFGEITEEGPGRLQPSNHTANCKLI